ncbi:MAG TPA: DUF58 domain-containing protein [Myxococcaceae bacterium]|nr:DUF58 domain-containing protein [Myxococcaceae bacterium]
MSASPAGLWRRFRRWFRPPRTLKTTRVGRTYLVLTLGVGFGALNTGNNLLYLLLGLLLSMIVLSGVLSERALRDLRVRRIGADGVHAGEPFAFRWAVSRSRGTAFALALSEESNELTGQGMVPFLEAGAELVVRGDLTAGRRGPHRLTGVRVTTTFPFGLFAKTRVFDLEGMLLVYPRRGYACEDPAAAEGGPAGDAGDPRKRDGSGDLLGLRELQPLEDARRIHWKKSAAAGKLLRVEREREERRTYLLRLDERLPPELLDRHCEELATVSRRLLLDGHEVGLQSGASRLRPGAGPGQLLRILRALAWAGYQGDRRDGEEAA